MLRYLQQVLRRRGPSGPSAEISSVEIDVDRNLNFLKLASACRTQNEFNRLRITLENVLTPGEIAAIATYDPPSPSAQYTRKWLARLGNWRPDLFQQPQDYARHSFSKDLVLYQDPRGAQREKGLLVAFTGNARRLMMPICVFLQFVDSRLWDVAVLKRPASGSFLLGYGDGFPGIVQHIQRSLSAERYRRVITLGTSSGGFAAIWAAVLMDAHRGISAAGALPKTIAPPMLERESSTKPELCYVYSEDDVQDCHAAHALEELYGGRRLPIADVDGHSVLGALMKQGRFGALIQDLLA